MVQFIKLGDYLIQFKKVQFQTTKLKTAFGTHEILKCHFSRFQVKSILGFHDRYDYPRYFHDLINLANTNKDYTDMTLTRAGFWGRGDAHVVLAGAGNMANPEQSSHFMRLRTWKRHQTSAFDDYGHITPLFRTHSFLLSHLKSW